MEDGCRFVKGKQVHPQAISGLLNAQAAFLFEDGDLVASVGVAKIEKQVICGVVLDGEALDRGSEGEVEKGADALRHLPVGQVGLYGEILVGNGGRGGVGMTQGGDSEAHDPIGPRDW